MSILNLSFEITTLLSIIGVSKVWSTNNENIYLANQRNTPLGLLSKVGNWHDNFTGYDDIEMVISTAAFYNCNLTQI